ncbi:MAG TPA: hypothetical protein VIN03_24045 [Roseateles sp.]
MATPSNPPPSGPLFLPWAAGPLLYSHWLIGALDAQTTVWREMERQAAGLLQFWFDPAKPPPSAQSVADAARGVAPLAPAAWPRVWSGWMHVWADAMRHDVAEG